MLPAFTGTQPWHYERQQGLCQGFTGINRSQTRVDWDSARLLTGIIRGGTGKKCDRVKKILRIIPVRRKKNRMDWGSTGNSETWALSVFPF
ncbi:hypothetical protein DPMN_124260 [Dreissena polymorpha]|uniref:Uncharacterized protein n=1 Tax=Dreissena polymorpha TaxID=45954 RepID=A0A9D4GRV0_DREPO|nr:hypothetical protein DPMN_124260 [Dreissena polymorpha]